MTIELGALISMLALIVVIVGHLCTTVWWMARLATTLERLSTDVKEAVKDIKGLVTKDDCQHSHDHIECVFSELWDAISKRVEKQ
jgi:uncharacterized protein YoxC